MHPPTVENLPRETSVSATLIDALNRIKEETAHGFSFVGFQPEERFISFRDIHAEASRRAAHLAALGLKKGDRLALVINDGDEFVKSFFGAVLAGVVPVSVSSPFTQKTVTSYIENLSRIIHTAGAQILLTGDKLRDTLQPVLELTDTLRRIITIEETFAAEPPPFAPPEVRPDDLCFLQFTSGSTSTPKGVMISHANLMANIYAFMGPHGMDCYPEDVGVSWLPLFHDMGLIGFILAPVITNRSAVIISTTTFARDPRIWLRTLHKYRGTITYAPNFAYSLAAKRLRDQDLENLDLSCVRIAGCGAEPIHAPTLRDFAARLATTGFRVEALVPSYGMAEATLAATFHRRGTPIRTETIDADALKWGQAVLATGAHRQVMEIVSCGVGFPEHQLAIVNEEGEALPERTVGEVILKGPSIARGYFNSAETTAATWTDGWLHTGDCGYLAGGELFICGRIKDLIIIRGANFYPHDIEGVVRELPGIKHGNVAAFGVVQDGQERLAVAAETDGRRDEALGKSIAERIRAAIGLEVHQLIFVPSGTLPKTSSGKLQRHKIKHLFETGRLQTSERKKRTPAPQALAPSEATAAVAGTNTGDMASQ